MCNIALYSTITRTVLVYYTKKTTAPKKKTSIGDLTFGARRAAFGSFLITSRYTDNSTNNATPRTLAQLRSTIRPINTL